MLHLAKSSFTVSLLCAFFAGVHVMPQAAAQATPTAHCPVTTTFTTTYTGLIEAPHTTYPYTTTVPITSVSYPLTTSTETGTWTYQGVTSTYTETYTYTNEFGPWPGC